MATATLAAAEEPAGETGERCPTPWISVGTTEHAAVAAGEKLPEETAQQEAGDQNLPRQSSYHSPKARKHLTTTADAPPENQSSL
jgi:hypothetical protein